VVFTCIKGDTLSILALYIDNITMACKSIEVIKEDKEKLKMHYQMTDLGEIAWILGVHCNATAGVIVRRAFESEFFVE